MQRAQPIILDSLDEPRLAVYRNLKDRELARQGDRFIAESEHVVRRLLASDYPIESVLISHRQVAEIAPIMRPDVPLFVLPDATMSQIIGYKFHSGVIACGRRKPSDSLTTILLPPGRRSTLVICPELASHENLGSIIRIASAFGADALVLGPRCCDPFYRQCIRVSMGTIFSLPLVRSGDLNALKQAGYELVATVLADDAEPLKDASRGQRLGIVFGNEAQGLDAATLSACNRKVTIPMRQGVDSLNVAVAAGIILHHFCR
jgi:tRNA G18 (ribose-2'-O)-methylase SpoU